MQVSLHVATQVSLDLSGNIVTWRSIRQSIVAKCTAKAELIASSEGAEQCFTLPVNQLHYLVVWDHCQTIDADALTKWLGANVSLKIKAALRLTGLADVESDADAEQLKSMKRLPSACALIMANEFASTMTSGGSCACSLKTLSLSSDGSDLFPLTLLRPSLLWSSGQEPASHCPQRLRDSQLCLNMSHAGTNVANCCMALTLIQMILALQQKIDVLDSELIIVENIPETVLQCCREEVS
eukprot:4901066-Amphidinium_carterae.2